MFFFFVKQKTADELRISDWSSDVCSSDLDVILVAARTGSEADGARGVTAFLVEMDAAGVSRSAYDDLGTRCVGRGSVWFDDVRVPAAARVGEQIGRAHV